MMNIDRLLLRINAVLDGAAEGFEARALASEYAALAESVRDRMRQCASLIKAGNDNAALQVAEAPPPVLDLAAKLAFDRSEVWRAHCKENRLPLAHKLEDSLVEQVNALYSKEIGESHPLYRDYRAAMREHDDLRALGVLRSITRVNSSDKNAQTEFERLSGKLRREMLVRLRDAKSHGQDGALFGVMAEMERAGLSPCPDSPDWVEAAALRDAWEAKLALGEAISLIPQIIAMRDAGEWEGAIPLLGRARALEKRHGFHWPEQELGVITHTETWVAGHASVVEKLRREEEKTEDLYRRLEEMEKRLEGPERAKAFLTADLSTVETWMEEAEALPESANFHAPIVRARHVRSKIKAALHRRRNRLLALALLASATAAGIVGAGVWSAASASRERAFEEGLAGAESSEPIRPVLAFLAGPARNNPGLAQAPGVADRVATLKRRADAADAARRALHEEAAAILRAASRPDAAVSALRPRALALAEGLSRLPSDVRAEVKPTCDEARTAVDERALKGPSEALAALLAEPADGLADDVGFNRLRDALRAALADPGTARPACVEAAGATLTRADAFAKLTVARRNAFAKLAHARSAASHEEAVAAIAALAEDTRETRAARNTAPHLAALKTLPDSLAKPEAAPMMEAARKAGDGSAFIAGEPTASERAAGGRIAAGARFAGVWRATRVGHVSGANTATPVFLKGRPTFEQFDLSGGYESRVKAEQINPDGTITKLSLIIRQFEGRQPIGETLENAVPTKEGELLASVSGLYDADRAAFSEPPLAALDRVVNSPADPLLKAWLQQEIMAVMSERPESWGLVFSPEAVKDEAALRAIAAAPLDGTQWMKPDKGAELRRRLAEFYATPRRPYLGAATFRHALALAMVKPGPAYAGRTDAEGRPGPVSGSPGSLILGLSRSGKPAVLGALSAEGTPTLRVTPAAYSPLLALPSPASKAGLKAPEGMTPPDGDWLHLFLPKP